MNLMQKQISFIQIFDNDNNYNADDIYDHSYQFIVEYKKALQDLGVDGTQMRDIVNNHFCSIDKAICKNIGLSNHNDDNDYNVWRRQVIDSILSGYDSDYEDEKEWFEKESKGEYSTINTITKTVVNLEVMGLTNKADTKMIREALINGNYVNFKSEDGSISLNILLSDLSEDLYNAIVINNVEFTLSALDGVTLHIKNTDVIRQVKKPKTPKEIYAC